MSGDSGHETADETARGTTDEGAREAAQSAQGAAHEAAASWDHLHWIRATDDPDPDAECVEIAAGPGDLVHIREANSPENVVTTTRAKWDAFVLGVRNNEFDHFVTGTGGPDARPSAARDDPAGPDDRRAVGR